jgi:hypothetical protein
MASERTGKFYTEVIFCLFLVLFILIKIFIFREFTTQIIDSDQPYMWLGAADYANGLFYEPRYYGQDYNTFMEALLAVPLVWLAVPVYYAVPAVTLFIAAFPILFIAICLFRLRLRLHATLVLAVAICLPVEYDLLTGLSRGFVTGIFFNGFLILSLLYPANAVYIVTSTLFTVLAWFVNPNSVIVSVPVMTYIFLNNYGSKKYYILTFLCLLSYFPLHYFFDGYYIKHPQAVQNDLHYRLTTDFFMTNITDLHRRFGHISFFLANNCWLLLLTLLALTVLLFRQNRKGFYSFLTLFAVLLFSFCSGKTQEGSSWVYMSFSRMYLGIPVIIAAFSVLIKIRSGALIKWVWLIPMLYGIYKLTYGKQLLQYNYKEENWVGVRLVPLADAVKTIDFYKEKAEANKAGLLIVSNGYWLHNLVTYGGPAVDMGFPLTLETKLEKRYHQKQELKNKIFSTFMLISVSYDIDKRIPATIGFTIRRLDDYGLYVITNNTLPAGYCVDVIRTYEERN